MTRSKQTAAGDPPRSRLSREAREQQLLDIAEREFIRNGYQGTSMEDIASAAGVSRPIVYGHFGSKDGLYLTCLQRARNRLDRQMMEAMQSTRDPVERLRRGARAYFEFVHSNSASWDLLFGGGTAIAGGAAERALDLRLVTVRQIAGVIAESVPHVDPLTVDIYAHAVSGAGEQIAKWWRRNPQVGVEQVAAHLTAFALDGMAPLLRGRPA
ncbi:TetR/AcrR family transcriptional regulator [Burkholderia alba]|uniref:TetR/AcrR family transcriptional regulator n=1 Tax=Burkholderia alba TaxID=2683677 RepID=UPI002B05F066|nr:TetR/AcrR family transcriptional regulator [Burkholderia alba]